MNKSEIYTRITDKLISKMSEGVIPWRRSWSIGIPRNLISKRAYNGINFLSLITEDHPSPYYLTFLQAKERGASINKGATGSLVVFGRSVNYPQKIPARKWFINLFLSSVTAMHIILAKHHFIQQLNLTTELSQQRN